MVSPTLLEQVQTSPDLEAQSARFSSSTRKLPVERLQSLDRTARRTRSLRPPSRVPSETCMNRHGRTHANDLRVHDRDPGARPAPGGTSGRGSARRSRRRCWLTPLYTRDPSPSQRPTARRSRQRRPSKSISRRNGRCAPRRSGNSLLRQQPETQIRVPLHELSNEISYMNRALPRPTRRARIHSGSGSEIEL
jgi:hypothetical protein